MAHVTVGLIEPMPLVLEALAAVLVGQGFHPSLAAGSLADAAVGWEGAAPALAVIGAPAWCDGAELETFRHRLPTVRVVALAPTLEVDALTRAFAAGADGFLLSGLAADVLAQALRVVLAGEKVFPSELAAAFRSAERRLSPRQREVLDGLARGDCNKVIARELGLSPETVRVHVRTVLRVLRAANRTEAAERLREFS